MKLPVVLLALLPCAAMAQQSDPVNALAAEAAEHFEAGRFCNAVQAYREAYKLEPLAELLYNIGYIYDRKLNDPAVARIYYRRFVRARDAKVSDKARLKAYERLDALDATLPPEGPVARPTGGAPSGGTPIVRREAIPALGDDGGNDLRTGAWVALGVGAAALITGTTFAALATHSHSQFEDAEDAATRRKLADEGEQRALIGDIGLGIGLAGLAAGGVLYLLSEEGSPSVGAVPTEGGFSLGFSGRF